MLTTLDTLRDPAGFGRRERNRLVKMFKLVAVLLPALALFGCSDDSSGGLTGKRSGCITNWPVHVSGRHHGILQSGDSMLGYGRRMRSFWPMHLNQPEPRHLRPQLARSDRPGGVSARRACVLQCCQPMLAHSRRMPSLRAVQLGEPPSFSLADVQSPPVRPSETGPAAALLVTPRR